MRILNWITKKSTLVIVCVFSLGSLYGSVVVPNLLDHVNGTTTYTIRHCPKGHNNIVIMHNKPYCATHTTK